VVLAPALGILLSLSELKIGSVIEASLLLIGHAAAGVALFLTGLILSLFGWTGRSLARPGWPISCGRS
jgi:predicted permease